MNVNAQRSARWLHTFAQIMEVDRKRPTVGGNVPEASRSREKDLVRGKEGGKHHE
ncbi:hypothetical protein TBH_C1250 [Thiolapillus brandeum]|uniref:Uncharacterized protein n=2 Tax=Thiolapillus brandeum TaxID=1076588 RepID=A0A7U6GID6_9GAMM|nr:hypothetical protein TBH_C1250 [Thiolapillus brandeum]